MIPKTVTTTLKRCEWFRNQIRACEEELSLNREMSIDELHFSKEEWRNIMISNIKDHKKKLNKLNNMLSRINKLKGQQKIEVI